jgi:DNA-binding NarL/FixJ family response regulator
VIRTLIADDHAVFREGLGRILDSSNGFDVVGEAASGGEALELARRLDPDVVVLDIWMPGRGGVETIQELKRTLPELRILVLTAHPENHYAVRCLRSGADGYVTKDRRGAEIVEAIRKVHAGGVFVSPGLAELLALSVKRDARQMPHETLSDREFQVMTMIAAGRTVSEIGVELNLSVKTISTYRSRVLAKLRLRNNAEIMRYGVEESLL